MDWLPIALEVAGALALAIAGWIGRSFRELRAEVDRRDAAADARMDKMDTRLVRCESVDASGAMERLGEAETRIAKLEAAQITHEDLGRVYRRLDKVIDGVSDVNASTAELKGGLRATQGQLTAVCDHLMERERK